MWAPPGRSRRRPSCAANFGIYYDQFRLGLARNVPAFGGTDQRNVQYLVFPRGFYGSPSFVSSIALFSGLPGGCFSNNLFGNLTDAQITAAGTRCLRLGASALPLIGVDRLNNVVAAGRSPIPANTVITADNVQSLTGLTPQQYADQASAAIGQPTGIFRLRSDRVVDQRDHSGAASSHRDR